MPQVQMSRDGEGADDQRAAGGTLTQEMYRRGVGFPSLDLPMGSWPEPPRDILDCILNKLKKHRDILVFSSVCAAWRSFMLENLQRFPRQLPLARCLSQFPLLMLPSRDRTKACDFFCLLEQKLYDGTPLPHSNKWIWGSSNGWLLTVDIRGGSKIYLFNPITKDRIYLPHKREIPRPKCDTPQFGLKTFGYLLKAAMSKSPTSNIEECAVMGIVSAPGALSFCRLGDSKWTGVVDSPRQLEDVICYKELFYAVNYKGVVVACDTGPHPKATAVVGRLDVYVDDEYLKRRYLIESRGELLQAVRIIGRPLVETGDDPLEEYRTIGFQVFKLQEKGPEDDQDTKIEEYESTDEELVPVKDSSYKWVKVDNLGDQIIFLGYNQSLSLPAGAMPNSRGNRIYFTDDDQDYHYGRLIYDIPERSTDMGVFNLERPTDMGVFNLEDGSVHPFHPNSLVFPMPPIWVSPAPF